ncbi:hypothetical protein, partial [Vibrio parahaemolyticus]|uniref:hypothetical protein n=1 Tax=Vibrio parahaemolyticus TaxID=670 RepID=UPI003D7CB9B8
PPPPPPPPLFKQTTAYEIVEPSRGLGDVYKRQVLWIVFGAIFLLNALKHTGAITTIRNGCLLYTSDAADDR